MEERENSQLAAGANNEEINHVLHQAGCYKNQGARPKQHNRWTKTNIPEETGRQTTKRRLPLFVNGVDKKD